MDIGNNARVIKEIKYSYDGIIQVDEIVEVIHKIRLGNCQALACAEE